MKKIEPFFLVIIDEDKKEFAVEGPTTDDSSQTRKVAIEQERGREVRCYSTGVREDTVNEMIAKGYKYLSQGGII
jgi:hypothetical protein